MSGGKISHGSGDPLDWQENGDKAPWWDHATSWHDIRLAVAAGLPVFVSSTGVRVNDVLELVDKGISDAQEVLIPVRFYEMVEQQAINSILSHKQ